jgi:hypothetical protein
MFIIYSSSSSFPSVVCSYIDFGLKNGKSLRYSLFGKGKEGMFSSDVDLYQFLLGYRSSPFFLSSHSVVDDDDVVVVDHDVSYCGMSIFPCSSLSYLLEKDFSFDSKKVNGMSEIVLMNEISLSCSVCVENVMMKSDESEGEGEEGKLKIEREINGGDDDFVLKLKEKVLFEKISFFSSSPSSFSFSLFSLVDGNISFKNCHFSSFSFSSFSLLCSSSSSLSPSSLLLNTPSLSLLIDRCSFMNIESEKEEGKILSIDDSFSSVVLHEVSFAGGWREENEKERRKNEREENEGEEEELSCSWSHSLLHFSSPSLSSSLEMVTIMNSREGGISIEEGGKVKIIDGMFENNTAESIKYPSFRHNILCLNGELNIQSLKGGDGLLPNSSLFIRSSDKCKFEGIVKNHPSPLFIPSISSIDPPNEENEKKISQWNSSLPLFSFSFFFL